MTQEELQEYNKMCAEIIGYEIQKDPTERFLVDIKLRLQKFGLKRMDWILIGI